MSRVIEKACWKDQTEGEVKESESASIFKIIDTTRVPGITRHYEGQTAYLVWNHGCNGLHHVDLLMEEYLDGGELSYADLIREVVVGKCDCNERHKTFVSHLYERLRPEFEEDVTHWLHIKKS